MPPPACRPSRWASARGDTISADNVVTNPPTSPRSRRYRRSAGLVKESRAGATSPGEHRGDDPSHGDAIELRRRVRDQAALLERMGGQRIGLLGFEPIRGQPPRARGLEQLLDLRAGRAAERPGTSIALSASAERSGASVVPAGFGPLSGPLRTFSDQPAGVAVAGPYVLAFEDAPGDPERQRLTVRNVETPGGPVREIPVPPGGGGAGILEANGDDAAFFVGNNPNARIVVVDVRTGAEVYRVSALVSDWGLGPDGRVVLVEHAKGGARIVTATPQDPGRRELTRMRLATPRVAVTPNGAALVRAAPNGLGQIVLAGYDGSVRPLTSALNAVNELDFDGTRLTFNAGHCVFVGPIPAGAPALAPRDACFNLPAQLDFGWMDRKAQVSGRAVRVGLRCQAPPRAHCPARLRLRGPGFTVRRRFTIAPGLHAVSIRIPAGSRDAAWRTGMTLETREHGRSSAGTVIPA